MVWLIALPIWVLLWELIITSRFKNKTAAGLYMLFCSLGVIFIMGLRSRYNGTGDTYLYTVTFDYAKTLSSLWEYLDAVTGARGSSIVSESGFAIYTWVAAQVLPSSQWFLLLSSTIIVVFTGKFIWKHSEDYAVSWITFICLGTMTFAMNGMRQAMAMSICLMAYDYAKERKLLKFLIVVAMAMLFHKSAIVFLLVYLLKNLHFNLKSGITFGIIALAILLSANRLARLYDLIMGEDYSLAVSAESGGVVVVLIYLIAIGCTLLFSKNLDNQNCLLPFWLICLGFALYISRFLSVAIFERMSYYFSYFLLLVFPNAFKNIKREGRGILKIIFLACAIILFVYRINKGVFSDFEMFWSVV